MLREHKKKVFVLLGPTAVGKTEISVKISELAPFEIISADSLQVYRCLDIGTAKPSKEILKRIPHHLINILDPDESYNVARFVDDAAKVIDDIHARGREVLIVGGAGMYLKRFLDGFFSGPGSDEAIRNKLRQTAEESGIGTLYDKLCRVDPAAAKKIHPNNFTRIIRALEVFEITGRPISEWQKQKSVIPDNIRFVKIGLMRDKPEIFRRIDIRIEEMFESGWMDEVRSLKERFDLNPAITRAVGYREILQDLEGSREPGDLRERIRKSTKLLVKKQLTWFLNDDNIHWFNLNNFPSSQLIDDIRRYIKEV